MPDTLTASFCERCGSRHEFRAPTGLNALRKTRGFIGGLRNYLVSDEALSEAMRGSMQMQESAVTAAQLDAFHAAVHLCLDCRQYTCNDCWNAGAGRCRSCAPLVGVDDLADRIAASLDATAAGVSEPPTIPVFEHDSSAPLPAESWPTADHEVYPGAAASAWPVEETRDPSRDATLEPEPQYGLTVIPSAEDADAAPSLDAEPVAAQAAEDTVAADLEWPEPEAFETVAEQVADDGAEAGEDAAAALAGTTRPPLRVVAWDDDAEPAEAVAAAAREDEGTAEVQTAEIDQLVAEAATPAEAPADAELATAAVAEHVEAEAAPAIAEQPIVEETPAFEAWQPEPETWTSPIGSARDGAGIPEAEAAVEPPAAAAPVAPERPEEVAATLEAEPQPIAPAIAAADAASVETAPEEEPAPAAAERAPEVELDAEVVAEPALPDVSVAAERPPQPGRGAPMRDRIVRLPRRDAAPPAPRVRVAAEADDDDVAARRAQLEELGLDASAAAASEAEVPQVLPYRSRGAPVSNREATVAAVTGSLWEASAREVGGAGVTVQSCAGCGLSLSASARFCRRCGTRQAQSA